MGPAVIHVVVDRVVARDDRSDNLIEMSIDGFLIPDENAPSFHEIRSLSKRLYDKQGNVDTKALLGHMSDMSAETYADARGIEPIRLKVGSYRILNRF
ncbi:hypothetical protein G3O00_15090 [Burkholderia sp. Ac-20384]|uniref:hypothetical protein n=1 Tax=Burkholderia sp. Ac-20384 TaxID=2703902 RepID=UPI00197E4D49|nr:hypothetical protein [Burkholderia sp. Ac-20384]MBN3824934.1 hypothetical protein [Burkholderia sp. Ac-20384]